VRALLSDKEEEENVAPVCAALKAAATRNRTKKLGSHLHVGQIFDSFSNIDTGANCDMRAYAGHSSHPKLCSSLGRML
jgi:hypothetical protein